LRDRLRQEGYKKACNEFSVEKMVQGYEKVALDIYSSKVK
jgi:hypothetical protein